jgi:hypothetical protein
MSATLHVLPSAELQNIPLMLRRLADDIETGEYGKVVECAVVTNSGKIEVFGYGSADGTTTHYLLGCGMARLQKPALDEP